MGWEERGGRLYYYRKRREDQTVISEYVGSGHLAELAAQLDELRREEQEEARQHERKKREEAEQQAQRVRAVMDSIRIFTHASLLAAGYHTHKGQWRKRREQGDEGERTDQGNR